MRQPAHFCGVYSLKPTDRRISTRGHIPEVPGMSKCIRQMMTVGCFARSVEDLQLCFSVIAGADDLQPDVPPVPLDAPSSKSLPDLKIAWMDGWEEVPVFSEIKVAIQSVAQTLTQAGAKVQRWKPENLDLAEMFRVCNQVTAFNNVYAQPQDRHTALRAIAFMFREATQGEKALRNFSSLSKWIKPSIRGMYGCAQCLQLQLLLIAQVELRLKSMAEGFPIFSHQAVIHCHLPLQGIL
jgi:amidase